MSWGIVRAIFGVVSGSLSLLLLGLPTWRVSQGALPVRRAAGLWIAGGGFGCLAVASFTPGTDQAQRLVVLGVTAMAAGTVLQGWVERREER